MTMRALQSVVAGTTETLVLSDVPIPRPATGEILVRVRTCGINYPDFLVIQDKYQVKHARPFSPGSEIAGDVVAVGPNVEGFEVGDAIMGTLDHGGLADYAVVEAVRCMRKPNAMPYDEAAAFLLTYGTSYHALRQRAELGAGQTLLVLGAAGGVGISAVQIGAAMGARVIAAASSQEKVDLALANGAAEGVVYPHGPFDRDGRKMLTDLLKQACGKGGADVVYDGVGGDYAEAALRAIAWEGRFLIVGFPAGIPTPPLNLTLLKACQMVGVFYGMWKQKNPESDKQNKRELVELYTQGKLRPHVSARFPLVRAREAIDKLASRTAMGKVVVMMESGEESDGEQ